MQIIDDLLATLNPEGTIKDIRQGTFWTAVMTRNCGLASTPHDVQYHHGDTPVKDAGNLINRSPIELAQMALSESSVEAALGIAAINSLLDIDEELCVELNAADLLMEQGVNKKVALIGHFPFAQRLRQAAGELWVIELNPLPGDIPGSEAVNFVPQADIVAITGSAFINHTIQGLLDLCNPNSQVIVLGPTTPLSPVLFDYGVDILSGTRVIEPEKAMNCVSQGATFRQMKGVRLLTMRKY